MSFTSYAENFEDVLLWRALGGVAAGFYVDVGAGDPRRHSVTQALYERGWRGINLEPAPGLQRRLRIERPADINLELGAAAQAGTAPFYEVRDAQLSSFEREGAARAGAAGHEVLLRRAATDTLDALCAAHGVGVLHLLKVDTGGSEQSVFDGFDLARWQPWIVLVNVADAGAVPAWQQRLLAAGYALAHDDGQNRYFSAPGRADLAAALRLPPHPADGFVLCEDHPYSHPLDAWRQRAASAEAEAAEARTWAQAHVREWQDKYRHLKDQSQQLAAMTERAAAAEGQIPPLTARAVQAGVVEQELAAVYASLSWRLTRPLREGKRRLGRLKGALRRRLGRARALGVRLLQAALRRAMHFVLTRPRLAFFVRRQAARFPGLLRLARSLVLRGQGGAAASPPDSAELSGLPEAARQVLHDLQRTRR